MSFSALRGAMVPPAMDPQIRLNRIRAKKGTPPFLAGSGGEGRSPKYVYGDYLNLDITNGVVSFTPEQNIIFGSKHDVRSYFLKGCPKEMTEYFIKIIKQHPNNSALKLLIMKLLYVYGMKKLSIEKDDAFIAKLDEFYAKSSQNPVSEFDHNALLVLEKDISISTKDLENLKSSGLKKFPHFRTASETARMLEVLDMKHLGIIPDDHKKLILKQLLVDIKGQNIGQIGYLTKDDFIEKIQSLKDTPSIIQDTENVFLKEIEGQSLIDTEKSKKIYNALQKQNIISEDGKTLDYMALDSLNKDTLKDKLALCELNDEQLDYVYKVLYGNLYSNTEFEYWIRKIQSMNENEFGLYKSKIQAGDQTYGKNGKRYKTPCLSEILFFQEDSNSEVYLIPITHYDLNLLNTKYKQNEKINEIAIKNSALGDNNIVKKADLLKFFENVKKFNNDSSNEQLSKFFEYCMNADPRIVLTTMNFVKNSGMSTPFFEKYLNFIESYLEDTDGNLSAKLNISKEHLQEVVIPTLLKNLKYEKKFYDQEHGRPEKALKLFNLIKRIAGKFTKRARIYFESPVYVSKNRGDVYCYSDEKVEKMIAGTDLFVPLDTRGAPMSTVPQAVPTGGRGRGGVPQQGVGWWAGTGVQQQVAGARGRGVPQQGVGWWAGTGVQQQVAGARGRGVPQQGVGWWAGTGVQQQVAGARGRGVPQQGVGWWAGTGVPQQGAGGRFCQGQGSASGVSSWQVPQQGAGVSFPQGQGSAPGVSSWQVPQQGAGGRFYQGQGSASGVSSWQVPKQGAAPVLANGVLSPGGPSGQGPNKAAVGRGAPQKKVGDKKKPKKQPTESSKLEEELANLPLPLTQEQLDDTAKKIMDELFTTTRWGKKLNEMEKWILKKISENKSRLNLEKHFNTDIKDKNWVSFCSKEGLKKIMFCHIPEEKIKEVDVIIVGVENGSVKCQPVTVSLPDKSSLHYKEGKVHYYPQKESMTVTKEIKNIIKDTKLGTMVFDSNTGSASSSASSKAPMSQKQVQKKEGGSTGPSGSASAGANNIDLGNKKDPKAGSASPSGSAAGVKRIPVEIMSDTESEDEGPPTKKSKKP